MQTLNVYNNINGSNHRLKGIKINDSLNQGNLILWEKSYMPSSQEHYSYTLLNKYGQYIYYITHDSKLNYYHLGFVIMLNSKEFSKPKSKHASLADAKKCADEHYLLCFS